MANGAGWDEVAKMLRAQRRVARLSLRSLARLTNVSDSYLSQVERGLYQPSPDVLKAIAGALGIPATSLYERLGWLDGKDDDGDPAGRPADDAVTATDVESAIDADPRLTGAQKTALRSMYRALLGDDDPGA